jgi:Uncharacterized protein conserved in bacteria (DUF2188)
MATAAIHIVPDDSFDDWVIRDDKGHELGHFATQESAEQAAEALARQREADLVIQLPDGRRAARALRGDGWPDGSRDDQTGSAGASVTP